MNATDIVNATMNVHGWTEHVVGSWRTYTDKERFQLAKAALEVVQSGSMIVEIGTYSGLSTAVLLHVARFKQAQLMACDMFCWRGEEAEVHLREVLCSFPDVRWRFYAGSSEQAYQIAAMPAVSGHIVVPPFVDHNVDFLHIDGDHYRVASDCALWLPHLKSGGMVAFHDANRNPAADQGSTVCKDADAYTKDWPLIFETPEENCLLIRRKL